MWQLEGDVMNHFGIVLAIISVTFLYLRVVFEVKRELLQKTTPAPLVRGNVGSDSKPQLWEQTHGLSS